MLGSHGETDHVPAALQGLPRSRFGPALLLAQRLDEPRLADPGFSEHAYGEPATLARGIQRAEQLAQFRLPADERTELGRRLPQAL